MDAIVASGTGVQITMETSLQVRDRWSTFALLDPANGPPSVEMKALAVPPAEWKKFEINGGPVDRSGLVPNWQ